MKDLKTFIGAKSLEASPRITATELSDDSHLEIDPGACPEFHGNSCHYDRFSQYSDQSKGEVAHSHDCNQDTMEEAEIIQDSEKDQYMKMYGISFKIPAMYILDANFYPGGK